MGNPRNSSATNPNPNPWAKRLRHWGILFGQSFGGLFSPLFIDGTEAGDGGAVVVAGAIGAGVGIFIVSIEGIL